MWVLVIFFIGGGAGVSTDTSLRFASEAACQAAFQQVNRMPVPRAGSIHAVCVANVAPK